MAKRIHAAKSNTLWYVLGAAVIIALAVYQSGFIRIGSVNTLGDTTSEQQQEQLQQQQEAQKHAQEQVTDQNRETEVRTATDVVKTEGVKPGYQFKLETQNGQSELQVEDANGKELHGADRNELEDDLEEEGIEISTEDGELAISADHVKAISSLPISVDKTRKQVLVTTPNGNIVSLLLPDAALQHLTNFGILTGSSPSAESATPSAFTLSANENGIPVYTVPGYKEEHLFGLIPVKVPVSAVLSAETGALMKEQQSFFGQLLDAVSF